MTDRSSAGVQGKKNSSNDNMDTSVKLAQKIQANEYAIWSLDWLASTDDADERLITGSIDGKLAMWSVSNPGDDTKNAPKVKEEEDDDDEDEDEEEEEDGNISTKQSKKHGKSDIIRKLCEIQIGICPITDIKCVLQYCSVTTSDSFVRIYNCRPSPSTTNTNTNTNAHAFFSLVRTIDMNQRHSGLIYKRVVTTVTTPAAINPLPNPSNHATAQAQALAQQQQQQTSSVVVSYEKYFGKPKSFGSCWVSDLNWDASICATGDQFGQIYLFSMHSANNRNTAGRHQNVAADVAAGGGTDTEIEFGNEFGLSVYQTQVNRIRLRNRAASAAASAAAATHPMGMHAHSNGSQHKQFGGGGANEYEIQRSCRSMVTCLTFNHSSNKNWLALYCRSMRKIEILDVQKEKVVSALVIKKNIHKNIRDLRWYSNEEAVEAYLCCTGDDRHILVYDPRESDVKKRCLVAQSAHESSCTSIDFGFSQIMASSSTNGTLKLWDLERERKYLKTFNDHTDQIWKLRFNARKDKLVTGGDDGLLCLYTFDLSLL